MFYKYKTRYELNTEDYLYNTETFPEHIQIGLSYHHFS